MTSDLSVKFGDILAKPSMFPTETGKLDIELTNKGNTAFNGPLSLRLYASTDNQLDLKTLNTDTPASGSKQRLQGTDELLGTLQRRNFQLAPGQTQTFSIDFAKPEFRTPSVVSPGLYYLFAEVTPGRNVAESNKANNVASQIITQGDPVIQWNSVLLNAIQASGKGDALKGTPPPIAARNQAIVHAAIYDAVNAFDGSHKQYLVNRKPPAGASMEAAVVGAAYESLKSLFPQQTATFDAQRSRALAEIQATASAEKAGFDFGVDVAKQIVNLRSQDGSDKAQAPYTPGNNPGDWQPTPSDGETTNNDTNLKPAALPKWGLVTPFAMSSPTQFRPDNLPEYSSPRYARELNFVKNNGGEISSSRTADQTQIAQFWAYDRDDTFRPPGQWNQIAQEVALDKGTSLKDNARLFAQLNIAQADAGIVAWNAKYTYQQFRPITAIRNADKDNNPNTQADPNWEPLLDTPPFPDYISGHATFGGAAATVLASYFGDNTSFNIPSQELPGVARSYNSFSQAAQENGISRLYGGIHINAANVDGVQVGNDVAKYVVDNFLK
jgi:membrane-associated phospholipid phosphatase